VAPVRGVFLAGDVSLALGASLLAAGLVVELAVPSSAARARSAADLYVAPTAGGATLGASMSF
jgi:hypothetical protein